jgi:hypothetical protein
VHIILKYYLCGARCDYVERLHCEYAIQIAQLTALTPSTDTHTCIWRRMRLLDLEANCGGILAEGNQVYPYEDCASFVDFILF